MSTAQTPGRRTQAIDAAFELVSAGLCWSIVGLGLAACGLVLVRALAGEASTIALGSALASSLALVGVALAVAAPLGIMTAVWLELRGRHPDVRRIFELDLALLDSVPPFVYGLVAVILIARGLGLGVGLASGGLALAAMVLPGVIAGARLAISEVSPAQLEAGYALGGSRGRLLVHVVLPAAAQGLAAVVCRAAARAFGSAAPLLVLLWLGSSGADTSVGSALAVVVFTGLVDHGPVAGAALMLLVAAGGLELVARSIEPRRRRGQR